MEALPRNQLLRITLNKTHFQSSSTKRDIVARIYRAKRKTTTAHAEREHGIGDVSASRNKITNLLKMWGVQRPPQCAVGICSD